MESSMYCSAENKTLFYRSRFTLSPESNGPSEIWPFIIQSIQGWLEEKEDDFDQRGFESALAELTDGISNIASNIANIAETCYANERLANGTLELETASSKITSKAVYLNRDDVPAYWALEYIEQSKDDWYRRWITNVGITDTGSGSYIVNTRVSIVDDPTFICDRPKIPPRNTPRFIGWLLDAKHCIADSNGIELSSRPIPLTTYNFGQFEHDLSDSGRSVPFVVVSAIRDRPGAYATSPYQLAKALRGSAVVYTLDCSDGRTHTAYRDVFLETDSAREYRINSGFMRVFFPGVDLDDPQGARRHRYYTQNYLETANQRSIANDICGAITRLYRRTQGEAIDFASLEAIKARASREQWERKFRESEKARIAEQAQLVSLEGLHGEDELREAVRQAQEKAEAQRKEDAEFYNEYIAGLEAENKRLQNNEDLVEAQIAIEDLNGRLQRMQSDIDSKKHTIATLQAKANMSEEAAVGFQDQANVIRSLDAFPQSTIEALNLAKHAFANELAFAKQAEQSAIEDGKNADPGEVFNILRALAVSLWPKYFERQESDGAAGAEFQNETGLEISFHESTMTNKDSRLKNQRIVHYDGREINMSPHVKGKSGGRDRKLRVHFAVDRATRKIVVCHCGAHKETAGTRKIR